MMQPTIIEGPLGLKVTDAQAKALQGILKTLPKDYAYRKYQSVPESTELVAGERADVSLVSTPTLDREGDVVLHKGVTLDWFRMNPVVTFAHKYDELPVGKCLWIKTVQRGLLAKTQYASRPPEWEGPWLPDAIFSMTKEGILRGKSVGFLPTKIRGATKAEITKNPDWTNARGIIEECMLLEYAIAPIPVNAHSLTLAVSKGLTDPATLRKLGLTLPPVSPKSGMSRVSAIDYAAFLEKYLDPERIARKVMNLL